MKKEKLSTPPEPFTVLDSPDEAMRKATEATHAGFAAGFIPARISHFFDDMNGRVMLTFGWKAKGASGKNTEWQATTDVSRYKAGDLYSMGGYWGCGVCGGWRYYMGQRNVKI